jgi:hypothetical protein
MFEEVATEVRGMGRQGLPPAARGWQGEKARPREARNVISNQGTPTTRDHVEGIQRVARNTSEFSAPRAVTAS